MTHTVPGAPAHAAHAAPAPRPSWQPLASSQRVGRVTFALPSVRQLAGPRSRCSHAAAAVASRRKPGKADGPVKIRVGFDIAYECPQPTPMILTLQCPLFAHLRPAGPRPSGDRATVAGNGLSGRLRQLVQPGIAPAGVTRFRADAIVRDPGTADKVDTRPAAPGAGPAGRDSGLPAGQPLLRHRTSHSRPPGSCSGGTLGWGRVQAICDFVHRHVTFGYEHARPTRPPGRPSTSATASAATSPTWRSPCADA